MEAARRRHPARHQRRVRDRHNGTVATVKRVYLPYLRDEETLARPWAIPGTPGLEHRVGGLEKAEYTGNVSYDPTNHGDDDRHPPGQDRRDRQRHPTGRGQRHRRRLICSSLAGARRLAPSPRRPRRLPGRRRSHPTPLTSPTSTRFAANLGESARAIRRSSFRSSTRASSVRSAGRVPGRRQVDHQGDGYPFTAGELVEPIREGI